MIDMTLAELMTGLDLEGDWRPIATEPRLGDPFLGAIWWADERRWEVLRMAWYPEFSRYGDATYAPFIDNQEQPKLWMPVPIPDEPWIENEAGEGEGSSPNSP
jgi:hypothetical protein